MSIAPTAPLASSICYLRRCPMMPNTARRMTEGCPRAAPRRRAPTARCTTVLSALQLTLTRLRLDDVSGPLGGLDGSASCTFYCAARAAASAAVPLRRAQTIGGLRVWRAVCGSRERVWRLRVSTVNLACVGLSPLHACALFSLGMLHARTREACAPLTLTRTLSCPRHLHLTDRIYSHAALWGMRAASESHNRESLVSVWCYLVSGHNA